jgi:hypothetical protein
LAVGGYVDESQRKGSRKDEEGVEVLAFLESYALAAVGTVFVINANKHFECRVASLVF